MTYPQSASDIEAQGTDNLFIFLKFASYSGKQYGFQIFHNPVRLINNTCIAKHFSTVCYCERSLDDNMY